VELMQLEMFIAVVEERSVRKAADRVFRTQPAVSIALRKLEEQAGTMLLDRSGRRAYRLTAAGELLYECASHMIAMRNEALSMLRGEKHSCAGRLSIGTSGAKTLQWASKLAAKFRLANPIVRVEILSDETDRLLSEITDRKLDVAFLPAYPENCQTGCRFILNPLRGFAPGDTLWLALPKAGCSHILRMFEEMVSSESAATIEGMPEARGKRPPLYAAASRAERTSRRRRA
jgi:DNA-binding transcriptional LysR family regulator